MTDKKESIVELSLLQKSIAEYHDTLKAAKQLDNDIIDLNQRIIDIDKEIQSSQDTIKACLLYTSKSRSDQSALFNATPFRDGIQFNSI